MEELIDQHTIRRPAPNSNILLEQHLEQSSREHNHLVVPAQLESRPLVQPFDQTLNRVPYQRSHNENSRSALIHLSIQHQLPLAVEPHKNSISALSRLESWIHFQNRPATKSPLNLANIPTSILRNIFKQLDPYGQFMLHVSSKAFSITGRDQIQNAIIPFADLRNLAQINARFRAILGPTVFKWYACREGLLDPLMTKYVKELCVTDIHMNSHMLMNMGTRFSRLKRIIIGAFATPQFLRYLDFACTKLWKTLLNRINFTLMYSFYVKIPSLSSEFRQKIDKMVIRYENSPTIRSNLMYILDFSYLKSLMFSGPDQSITRETREVLETTIRQLLERNQRTLTELIFDPTIHFSNSSTPPDLESCKNLNVLVGTYKETLHRFANATDINFLTEITIVQDGNMDRLILKATNLPNVKKFVYLFAENRNSANNPNTRTFAYIIQLCLNLVHLVIMPYETNTELTAIIDIVSTISFLKILEYKPRNFSQPTNLPFSFIFLGKLASHPGIKNLDLVVYHQDHNEVLNMLGFYIYVFSDTSKNLEICGPCVQMDRRKITYHDLYTTFIGTQGYHPVDTYEIQTTGIKTPCTNETEKEIDSGVQKVTYRFEQFKNNQNTIPIPGLQQMRVTYCQSNKTDCIYELIARNDDSNFRTVLYDEERGKFWSWKLATGISRKLVAYQRLFGDEGMPRMPPLSVLFRTCRIRVLLYLSAEPKNA